MAEENPDTTPKAAKTETPFKKFERLAKKVIRARRTRSTDKPRGKGLMP
jgi:hypothetical protein